LFNRPVHHVRVNPNGLVLGVKDGQTIFKAARDAGIEWPTQCGGAGQCTFCTMTVTEGAENLSAADKDELFRTAAWIRKLGIEPARLRLACAARVRGPVVVEPRYPLRSCHVDEHRPSN
jgi:ferredoxin